MNRSDLEKIVAIAEEGSMAKAAQRLYITQPALSKCLGRVEEELGEPLFLRRPNGLTLTYSGECLVQKSYQILRLYRDLEMDFCDLNEMRRGVLRVGAARRISAVVLPEAIARFSARYPSIKIEIAEQNSFVLEEQIMTGKLDIAIVCLPVRNENVHYTVFYRDPFLIAVPKDHPVNAMGYTVPGEKLPFLSVKALRGQQLVLSSPEKKSRIMANKALEVLDGDYTVRLESHNIELVIRFIAKGLGIGIVPSVFASQYPEPEEVNYYRFPESEEIFHQWAVMYGDSIASLPRPSRELYRILCEEKCIFPDFLG